MTTRDDDFEQLFREATARAAPPDDVTTRVRGNVLDAWEEHTVVRRRRRWGSLAAAAAVLLAAGLALVNTWQPGQPAVAPVANVRTAPSSRERNSPTACAKAPSHAYILITRMPASTSFITPIRLSAREATSRLRT